MSKYQDLIAIVMIVIANILWFVMLLTINISGEKWVIILLYLFGILIQFCLTTTLLYHITSYILKYHRTVHDLNVLDYNQIL